jgi:uncharacterized protein (TIGR02996 family)
MTEEAGFLEAILRAPADDTLRLVYADWLEERGDGRAELLRVEDHLRRTNAREPGYRAALARWLHLRDRVPADWIDALGARVNGLPLPLELVDLLAKGRWGSASEMDRLLGSPWSGFDPYPQKAMGLETSHVCYHLNRLMLGSSDTEHPPGDIEPKLTVLIADEGIGSDSPFALDYRASFGQPRVLLYRWWLASNTGSGNRWIEVAPDFSTFWRKVGDSLA